MQEASIKVERIVSLRLGGCIFAGRFPDGTSVRVVAAADLIGAPPSVGEVWKVRGKLERSRWGPQLRAEAAWRTAPSGALIGAWIMDNVPGMGKSRTQRLLSAFGSGLGALLDAGDPEPLVAVLAPEHPNLGARLAASLVGMWRDQKVSADLHAWLDRHGVQVPRLARRLAALLGDDAIDALEANPYCLVGVLPWDQVDDLGLRLMAGTATGAVDASKDARRLVGMVDAIVIERITRTGDTAITPEDLRAAIARRLAGSVRDREVLTVVEMAVGLAESNDAVLRDTHRSGIEILRAPGCALMEVSLAERIRDLAWGPWRSSVPLTDADARRRLLEAASRAEGVRLHPEQAKACIDVLGLPLAVLTGGAGVGKTTTTRAVVSAWEAAGGRVELCALSGKAARRLGQATGRLARTIFRLVRDLRLRQDNPAADAIGTDIASLDGRTLLVVDEASMVDLGQFTELLVDHLPPGCHVLLVGDPAQLPPIGPGLVFPVLCGIPSLVCKLTTVHRQTGSTGIPAVSRTIRSGAAPDLPAFDPDRPQGVAFVSCAPDAVAAEVHRIVKALGGHGPAGHELLVLSPTNDRHPCAVHPMNRSFQAGRLAAEGLDEESLLAGSFGQRFGTGDPVVFTRNLYRDGLCNGMLGRVASVDLGARTVVVLFDDGEHHEIGPDRLPDLQLAYALSCHKAQGSSARRIVVPVYPSRIIDRAWLYTAVTRSEETCVLVGDLRCFQDAIIDEPRASRRLHGFAVALG